jgi:hypothetical protein
MLCRTTREVRLNQRLYSRPDAPFQISRVSLFNLVPSGRPLMAVRTTSVLLVIFVKTSLRPDESASRLDAPKLIRVFMNKSLYCI